jgi:hypothetical protein
LVTSLRNVTSGDFNSRPKSKGNRRDAESAEKDAEVRDQTEKHFAAGFSYLSQITPYLLGVCLGVSAVASCMPLEN